MVKIRRVIRASFDTATAVTRIDLRLLRKTTAVTRVDPRLVRQA